MGSRTKSLYGQEIMTLESLPEINQLYSTMDLDFRPQVAGTAIGTLVTRAITTMRQPMPQALPVLVVANWNARSAEMNNEMMASRALAHSKTMRDIAGVTAHYSHAPWYMRFCFQPSQAQQPVPKRLFQLTFMMKHRDLALLWPLQFSRIMSVYFVMTRFCAKLCMIRPAPLAWPSL